MPINQSVLEQLQKSGGGGDGSAGVNFSDVNYTSTGGMVCLIFSNSLRLKEINKNSHFK